MVLILNGTEIYQFFSVDIESFQHIWFSVLPTIANYLKQRIISTTLIKTKCCMPLSISLIVTSVLYYIFYLDHGIKSLLS